MESTAMSSSMESSASASSSMESPASSSSSPWRLGSTSTYLFGGIGAMLLLLALALLMLACSHLRHRYEDTSDRKAVKHAVCKDGDEANASPKIVVIMAGEEIPTYLAAPSHVSSSRNRNNQNSNQSL